MKDKSYPLDSIQNSVLFEKRKGKIQKKKCYQCNQQSVIKYKNSFGDWSNECLNNCGPEMLSNLLNFGGR